jgi:hypothetical protein
VRLSLLSAIAAGAFADRQVGIKVNEAVRDGLISDLAGWRPAGSADLYGVPKATE